MPTSKRSFKLKFTLHKSQPLTAGKLKTSLSANTITAKLTNHFQQTRLTTIDWQTLFMITWLWRWLSLRLSKRQSPTTVQYTQCECATNTLDWHGVLDWVNCSWKKLHVPASKVTGCRPVDIIQVFITWLNCEVFTTSLLRQVLV